ncbi:hypothetical protein [Roseibium aggregatum]|uniref:Uncharacterized protein n=1 Tax=Roseibium aggregatum TaxID=187304 RepID=A0A0M6YD13_9HYPH|nr:hypothetical protein [Roseibium aggregatum]CTQ47568.1 hypothetical protein LAL4801_06030 [Roseibium aggregatum]
MGGTNKSVIGTFGNGVIITGTGPGGGGITIIPPGSLRNQSNFSLGLERFDGPVLDFLKSQFSSIVSVSGAALEHVRPLAPMGKTIGALAVPIDAISRSMDDEGFTSDDVVAFSSGTITGIVAGFTIGSLPGALIGWGVSAAADASANPNIPKTNFDALARPEVTGWFDKNGEKIGRTEYIPARDSTSPTGYSYHIRYYDLKGVLVKEKTIVMPKDNSFLFKRFTR